MTFNQLRRNFLKGAAALAGSFMMPKLSYSAERMYSRGYRGYLSDKEAEEQYNASVTYQNYGDVCDTYGAWPAYEEGLYLPYLSVIKAEAIEKSIAGNWAELTANVWPWPESQTVGDCVSHQIRAGCDIARATDVYGNDEDERWETRTATEPIYGARGHAGHGANCERLLNFVQSDGGMMLRKKYDVEGFGELDLSKYNASIGTNWGRKGTPLTVKKVARKHQIIESTRVEDREQLRAAYRNGLAVGGCSMIAFSRRRNEDGVSAVQGSWAHAMQGIGFDERPETIRKYGCPLVLEQNSWGAWNSGPRTIRGTNLLIPKGSCWVKEDDYVRRKIESGSCFTMCGARGWDVLRLTNFGLDAFG